MSADPPARGWTGLAPIAPTWSARSPLTTGTEPIRAPGLDLRGGQPSRSVPDGAPEPGRVVGLAAVVAPLPAVPSEPAPLPEYFTSQPPLRHATARPIVEHAPLTEATHEWVGEPIVAAPPPPPPAPAPSLFPTQPPVRADPPVEALTEAGAAFREALANLHKRGAPDYVPGQSDDAPPPRPAVEAPPAQTPPPRPSSQRPLTYRRNSLAESRRLGLGAPLRAGQDEDEQPLTHPRSERPAVEAAPETPPAPPAASAPPPAAASAPTSPPTPTPTPVADQASSTPTPRHAAADDRSDEGSDDGDDSDDGPGPGGRSGGREPIRPVPTVRPIASGSARPTANVAPLVFRAAVRPVDAAPAEPTIVRAPERAVITRPPAELAQALRTSHGVDVADVPVRRDADSGSEARQRKARAFTRGATVYLPAEADPGTSAAARGLLAHELVHAAQQRRLGGALPGEDTTEGRTLEAEAVEAERLYSHPVDIAAETQLVHAPPPVTANWVEDRIVQHAPVQAPPQLPPSLEPMRHDIEQVADHSARRVVAEWTNPALPAQPGAPVHIPGLNAQAPPGVGPAHLPVAPGAPTATPPRLSKDSAPDENQREQQYLDMLNAVHLRRNEAVQLELTSEDRDDMYDLWGAPGSNAGSQTPQQPATMAWTPGKGFVASGPGAAAAAEHMQSAWGGLAIGSMFAPHVAEETPGAATAGAAAAGAGAGAGAGHAVSHQLSMADALAGLFGIHHETTGSQGAGTSPATTATGQTGAAATTPGATPAAAVPAGSTAAGFSATHADPDEPLDLGRLDMEDLSGRIYNRLRRQLRQELLVDRERAGLLTDYR